jgi:Zn-dependent peptidase ImmA (M78 family)/DNA-binding XRE family transcriptional regulator
MAVFNPTRLLLAPERRGLLAKDLASKCQVTPQTVTHWESGETRPSEELIVRIAEVTGFPLAFFSLGDIDSLPEGSVTFRARSRIPARQKRSALAAGTLARELTIWIEQRFDLPKVSLPDLTDQPPDLVARIIRAEWMLGDKPIPNMIHLLESRGVFVLSLAEDVHELDAFSFWSGKRPIVLLNTMKSAERSRMDAAHELMHLLAHREETDKSEEEEANKFAGAFLMPKESLFANAPRIPALPQLIDAKRRWGVALAALVVRLHEVGILSDWQYRMLFIDLSKRGYRTREPNPIPQRESSTLLAQVFRFLAGQNIKPATVARELAWNRKQIEELIFGLGATLISVDGGRHRAATREKENHLRLLEPTDKREKD